MGQHIGGVVQPLYKTSLINDANLVSYWRLKDNANDYKGTNNGTATSVSFSPDYGKFGNYGQGASFNGSTSYISLPNAAGINTTFTFSCWVKIDSFEALGLYSKGSDGSDGWGACVYFADSLINFSVTTTSPSPASYYVLGSIPSFNVWYHVAAVFDDTNKKIRLYINGVLTSEASTGSSLRGTDNVYLGVLKLGSSSFYYYLDGNIDDAAIFNRVLSADEILLLATGCQNKELYTTNFINDDNLVAYWRFEGNSYDSKGSFNGTDTAVTYGTNYGKFGQGASFNGSTSKIMVQSSSIFNFGGNPFSLSTWVYNITTSNSSAIFQLGEHVAGVKFWEFFVADNSFSTNLYNGGYKIQLAAYVSSTLNNWYHAVVTFNSPYFSIYVNGNLVAREAYTGTASDFPSNEEFRIVGVKDNGSWYYQQCYLDDVALFNRSLTAREVKQLYRQTPKQNFYFNNIYPSFSGGVETYDGNYKIHTFTSTGTLTTIRPGNVEYLIVAGGGPGGTGTNRTSGGGGAGGLLTSSISISDTTYTISIGGGGSSNSNGTNSSAFGLTAVGGGYGGLYNGSYLNGNLGGSGGGAQHNPSSNYGLGTNGQGNRGGLGYDSGNLSLQFGGGGGGGAGAIGENANSSTTSRAGDGGVGIQSSITGNYYAGGGGGGAQRGPSAPSYGAGQGGNGGGGAGGVSNTSDGGNSNGSSGSVNTGGGGGGGGTGTPNSITGGNGGSGIVIIKYRYK